MPGSAATPRSALPAGQRGMVFDFVHLGFLRQQVIEVTAQAGRILALAIPLHFRPIQDTLDAAPHPAGGLGLANPDRPQHLHHEAGVDGLHRQRPEHGVGIGLQRVGPLLARGPLG
jgi:hypothetical protein